VIPNSDHQPSEQRLLKVFEEVLWGDLVPPSQTTRYTSSVWDSLAQVSLVLAIEQEFGFTFSDDEVDELNSFASALQIVQSKELPRDHDGS
jgi:acyl carrier protein